MTKKFDPNVVDPFRDCERLDWLEQDLSRRLISVHEHSLAFGISLRESIDLREAVDLLMKETS